jgi:hypothetical protein
MQVGDHVDHLHRRRVLACHVQREPSEAVPDPKARQIGVDDQPHHRPRRLGGPAAANGHVQRQISPAVLCLEGGRTPVDEEPDHLQRNAASGGHVQRERPVATRFEEGVRVGVHEHPDHLQLRPARREVRRMAPVVVLMFERFGALHEEKKQHFGRRSVGGGHVQRQASAAARVRRR